MQFLLDRIPNTTESRSQSANMSGMRQPDILHSYPTVVSPGPINTPLVSRQSAHMIARIVSSIPMGRVGQPEELAKAALYLASDDSSLLRVSNHSLTAAGLRPSRTAWGR
jgi:Enoyl-(Acyl carrier protein) reductase